MKQVTEQIHNVFDAVQSGDQTAMRELIDAGADVDSAEATTGWTALCYAAGAGDLEMVQLLLEHCADISHSTLDHRTPREIALAAGHSKIAELIKEKILDGTSLGAPEQFTIKSYCQAYLRSAFEEYPEWEKQVPTPSAHGSDVLYLHENYVVTKSVWSDDVVFEKVNEDWKAFCDSVLGFRVPRESELI